MPAPETTPTEATWLATLAAYRAAAISRADLWSAWLAETERRCLFAIQADRQHHAQPLFENGWSPTDAADHLQRVWIMKGWIARA